MKRFCRIHGRPDHAHMRACMWCLVRFKDGQPACWHAMMTQREERWVCVEYE